MSEKPSIRTYTSDAIDVHYDTKRCIHAEECVHRLRAVFNPQARPWIQPGNASAEEIASTIETCPSGALAYTRKDGGPAETPDDTNIIHIEAGGPLYVRGVVRITSGDSTWTHEDQRVALCRCGQSNHKPFCDNAHKDAGFDAGDVLANNLAKSTPLEEAGGPLAITTATDGPLLLDGAFTLHSSDGSTVYSGRSTALCRCGQSGNKPFCDGTHRKVGFTAR